MRQQQFLTLIISIIVQLIPQILAFIQPGTLDDQWCDIAARTMANTSALAGLNSTRTYRAVQRICTECSRMSPNSESQRMTFQQKCNHLVYCHAHRAIFNGTHCSCASGWLNGDDSLTIGDRQCSRPACLHGALRLCDYEPHLRYQHGHVCSISDQVTHHCECESLMYSGIHCQHTECTNGKVIPFEWKIGQSSAQTIHASYCECFEGFGGALCERTKTRMQTVPVLVIFGVFFMIAACICFRNAQNSFTVTSTSTMALLVPASDSHLNLPPVQNGMQQSKITTNANDYEITTIPQSPNRRQSTVVRTVSNGQGMVFAVT